MTLDDRQEIIRLVNEWNSSRYELFALSQPNEVNAYFKKKTFNNNL